MHILYILYLCCCCESWSVPFLQEATHNVNYNLYKEVRRC